MEKFKVVGISTRTNNLDGNAVNELGKLWEYFIKNNIVDKIPHKVNNDIYAIYTDYESDYRGEYTCLIGCEVRFIDNIPPDFEGRVFKKQQEKHYIAKGELPHAVADIWRDIWNANGQLNRLYDYDYERYSEKSYHGEDSIVDIYVGVKE